MPVNNRRPGYYKYFPCPTCGRQVRAYFEKRTGYINFFSRHLKPDLSGEFCRPVISGVLTIGGNGVK